MKKKNYKAKNYPIIFYNFLGHIGTIKKTNSKKNQIPKNTRVPSLKKTNN